MSGPKIDQAELDRLMRIALEQERQERLRKIRLSTENFNTVSSSVKAKCLYIDKSYFREISAVCGLKELELTAENIKSIKNNYIEILHEIMRVSVPTEAENIDKVAQAMVSIAEKTLSEYEQAIKPEIQRISDYSSGKDRQQQLETLSNQLKAEAQTSSFIDFDFTASKDNIGQLQALKSITKSDINNVMSEIEGLVNSEFIAYNDKRVLIIIAKNILNASFQGESAVNTAVTEYRIAKKGVNDRIEKFEELYQTYYAEYVLFIEEINLSRKNKLQIFPKEKYMFLDLEQLEAEVKKLQQMSKKQNEQNYIRQQINEVMLLFGYDMCEDIVLDAEQKGNHYLCGSMNSNTAIHIHVSDSKQIMMEVVGTRKETAKNKQAASSNIISAEKLDNSEINALYQEQGKFCEIHPEITKELSKRGVILNPKNHRLPDKKYCKVIVNDVNTEDGILSDSENIINDSYSKQRRTVKPKEKEMAVE